MFSAVNFNLPCIFGVLFKVVVPHLGSIIIVPSLLSLVILQQSSPVVN